ncbi:hypothetical protein, partial [Acinetobacter baumannii]|uniref:hypothetical protein n=1 Tax=Acinetobacter baumannii TaxID=470 RepID=UPI001BB46940
TYPSYALNLAQLGALCISNLCATKPLNNKNFSIKCFFINIYTKYCIDHMSCVFREQNLRNIS